MTADRIQIGDTVTVHFSTHMSRTGVVRRLPAATGDSWQIIEAGSGTVLYIQQFDYMQLHEPAPD